MPYRAFADLVVLVHLAFVLFAVFGGILLLRWKRCAWIHVPAALWAALVEFMGWICPLTPLENWLRDRGGASGSREDFVEHYVLPVLYPASLPRPSQIALGIFVLGINVGVYALVSRRSMRTKT